MTVFRKWCLFVALGVLLATPATVFAQSWDNDINEANGVTISADNNGDFAGSESIRFNTSGVRVLELFNNAAVFSQKLSSDADLTVWAGANDNGNAGDLNLYRNAGAAGVYDSYIQLKDTVIDMGGNAVSIHDALIVDGGLNNSNDGITNAGAVSGVTTLTASTSVDVPLVTNISNVVIRADSDASHGGTEAITLQASGVSAVSITSTNTAVATLLTANGGITADGGVFTVADTTGNVATSGTLTAAGLTTLNGGITADGGVFTVADTTGNVYTSGTLGVDGNTTLGNASTDTTTVNGTFYVKDGSGNSNASINGDTGVATFGGGDANGTVNVANAAGTTRLTLTAVGATGTMSGDADVVIAADSDANNANESVTLKASGVTTVVSKAASTAITTSAAGHDLTVSSSTTTINGTATINSGNADGHQLIVDATSSRLVSDSGNRSVAVNDTSVTIASTTGSNSVVVREDQTGSITDINGNTNTFTYGTRVNGGMYVDGDLGVNGNIYTLNTTANASVAVGNNGLNITGASNDVTLVADEDSTSTDERAQLHLTTTTADLTVVNTTTGNTHGLSVAQSQTVLSGGTTSTSLTLNDTGATFRDDTTGGPAKVTGVADGSSDYDAVNYRQIKGLRTEMQAGVASVAALAAIPGPVPGKKYSIGGGVGHFGNEDAVALGVATVVGKNKDISIRAGFGYSHDLVTTNAGVSWSF